MSLAPFLMPENTGTSLDSAADLVQPRASLLAALLEARVENEEKGAKPGPLPPGVKHDLRPRLPKIGLKSILLFAQRKAVESYPMIYTTLAVAHPN
jgi:hypothetical protein